jgi:hypothetical protein
MSPLRLAKRLAPIYLSKDKNTPVKCKLKKQKQKQKTKNFNLKRTLKKKTKIIF